MQNKSLIFLIIVSIFTLYGCHKGEVITADYYTCNFSFEDSSAINPENNNYQAVLDDMTSSGVVGVLMSVYHPQTGMWMGAGGKADLFNDIDMQVCNITRVGSTVKMFTATIVLKLMEEGKLSLDDKISDYLDGNVINKIPNADIATIRQLMQHSSGVYNYIQNLQFQTASINDFIREWQPEDLLDYAYGQEAYFAPDEEVRYSNTGYILLGMLIEKIEGKPFYEVFAAKIFDPLNLTMTTFAAKDHIPYGIVRGYIDMYSKLQVTESTYYSGWDYYTADGGLISNPYDMNIFFRALMQGEIISETTLNEMLDWKTPVHPDPDFFPIDYGLGIFRIITDQGIAYMHSGDAVGYYANMIYFPEDSTTVVYAVNSNYGKIDQFVSTKSAMEKIILATK